MNENDSICDRCATEMSSDESNDVDSGEWAKCTVCNECAAELNRAGNTDGTDLVITPQKG